MFSHGIVIYCKILIPCPSLDLTSPLLWLSVDEYIYFVGKMQPGTIFSFIVLQKYDTSGLSSFCDAFCTAVALTEFLFIAFFSATIN